MADVNFFKFDLRELEFTLFEQFKLTSERLFLEGKLIENEWNIKRTAENLGMQRSHLYKKIEKYHLK